MQNDSPKVEKTVFISYRRKDISWALLVFKYLTENGYDVFFDYTSIASGDFEQIIIGNIKARAHFLVILTPSAIDRCNQHGDWLRREIETAMDEKRNIIPLLFDGFTFGDQSISKKLTGKLGAIRKYNGLVVPAGYFDAAMEKLHSKYLNIALDAVLHPVSDEVQKVTKEQKVAAGEEIARQEEYKGSGGAILLDGMIVSYKALGRGRPVIFLHSWIGSWQYWIASMQVVSRMFRGYALDLWGYGNSARDPMRYSIEQQTDLLSQFFDDMGIGKVAIVGHGLGSLVGLNFCLRWPQSVDRMMAISCPMFYESINTRLQTSSLPDLIKWLGSKSPEATSLLSEASIADPLAIIESINSFKSNDIFGKMRQTQIPCLLVYGKYDRAIPAPYEDISINLPHLMHQIVFDGSGHFPMIDESARFNRLLTDFLGLNSGVSPRELQKKDEWKRREK